RCQNPRCSMGKNILIIALASILVVCAVLQNQYISSSYKDLSAGTDQIQQEIVGRDVQKTNESIDAFGRIWEKNSDGWMSLMLHEQVDSIFVNYYLMKDYAAAGDLDRAAVYLGQLKYALSDVYNIDQLNARNIF
ncbi:MAG: DUF4363 family protein, partial [Eubacteriales bacterium]